MAKALASYAAHPTVTITARDAVEQARLGMAGAFDPVAQRVLAQDYLPLDHLDGLPHPDADAGTRMVASRLNGEDPAVVSAKRRQAAKDCMTVAVSMRQQDRLDDAMQHAWQADWAAFESYLIDAAMQVGDANLASVDLRWALAVDEIGKIQALPTDFVEAVTAIRARLIHSLGSIEGTRLADRFEPLT